MEDELIAQRDAAIAVNKELQKQLQHHKEVVERTIERRALNAERLRLHAEEQLRQNLEDQAWESKICHRQLYLSLFSGMTGGIIGWFIGLFVFILFQQPTIGFLLVLPGLAFGTLFGIAFAKTKVQLEARRRESRKKLAARRAEVDMAVERSSGDGQEDMEDCMDEYSPRSKSGSNCLDEDMYMDPPSSSSGNGNSSSSSSWTSSSLWLLQHSLTTSKDLAVSIYNGSTSVLYSSQHQSIETTSLSSSKKDQ